MGVKGDGLSTGVITSCTRSIRIRRRWLVSAGSITFTNASIFVVDDDWKTKGRADDEAQSLCL